MRVVVIGGLGNFGARICRRLAHESGFEILATSRRCSANGMPPSIETAILDINSRTFAADLKSLKPGLVIHCAGPFQGQDYRVALASLASGANYIDIADGRDFVTGFVREVGPAAERAERFAITGASTLPALSSAVVDSLKRVLASLDGIDIVIAPGQHAPRGVATVAGVLGYAGQPFEWWKEREWRTAYGWQELKREHFPLVRDSQPPATCRTWTCCRRDIRVCGRSRFEPHWRYRCSITRCGWRLRSGEWGWFFRWLAGEPLSIISALGSTGWVATPAECRFGFLEKTMQGGRRVEHGSSWRKITMVLKSRAWRRSFLPTSGEAAMRSRRVPMSVWEFLSSQTSSQSSRDGVYQQRWVDSHQ